MVPSRAGVRRPSLWRLSPRLDRHEVGHASSMGLVLILIGLVLWLATGLFWAFIICLILGLLLLFWPGAPYGYSSWRGTRAPP
jgi:fatty acid desaturase